jgi:hypothetical protein
MLSETAAHGAIGLYELWRIRSVDFVSKLAMKIAHRFGIQ